MKIYFKEITTKDFSRVGYDTVSINCSLTPYGTDEGHDANSCWYFIEIGDNYTQDEGIKLARCAIDKALASQTSVSAALFSLTNGKRRRKRS